MANSPPGRVWVSVEDRDCFNGTSTDLSNELSYAFGSGIEGEGYAGTYVKLSIYGYFTMS